MTIINMFVSKFLTKNILFYFLMIVCVVCFHTKINAQTSKVNTIILDAGHGGKDPGARGTFSNEKDITLQVVLKLKDMFGKYNSGKKVYLTRNSDTYPSLVERHEIANSARGDLFVSVHVNSTAGSYSRIQSGTKKVKIGKNKYKEVPIYKTAHSRGTDRTGTETYVLGLHRNDQKESALSDNKDNVIDEGETLNPNDPATSIVVAQYSQAYLERSISLGALIEDEFSKIGRRSEGVKQKGLEVLAGSAMPGVLVEIGFINNPEDEAFLNSDAGQWQVAQCIYNGIIKYISMIDNKHKL